MSCLDCDNCAKNIAPLPECFTGILNILGAEDILCVVFEKAGGGNLRIEFQGDVPNVEIDFSQIDNYFFREASGLIAVRAYQSGFEPTEIIDQTSGMSARSFCVLIEFKASVPDRDEIDLHFIEP